MSFSARCVYGLLPGVCFGLLLLCASASADTETNTPMVLVTATRDARLLKDAPYAGSLLPAVARSAPAAASPRC